MAPEIVCNKGYSFSVDWWALGVLFYELLTGYTPFPVDENTKQNSFKQIKNAKIPMLDSISKDAKSLIRGLLEKDPLKRLGKFLSPGFTLLIAIYVQNSTVLLSIHKLTIYFYYLNCYFLLQDLAEKMLNKSKHTHFSMELIGKK